MYNAKKFNAPPFTKRRSEQSVVGSSSGHAASEDKLATGAAAVDAYIVCLGGTELL